MNEKNMNWFKKHADTVIVVGGILASFLYMQSQFSAIEKRFSSIDTRLVRIETVLFLKGIFPSEYASKEEGK